MTLVLRFETGLSNASYGEREHTAVLCLGRHPVARWPVESWLFDRLDSDADAAEQFVAEKLAALLTREV